MVFSLNYQNINLPTIAVEGSQKIVKHSLLINGTVYFVKAHIHPSLNHDENLVGCLVSKINLLTQYIHMFSENYHEKVNLLIQNDAIQNRDYSSGKDVFQKIKRPVLPSVYSPFELIEVIEESIELQKMNMRNMEEAKSCLVHHNADIKFKASSLINSVDKGDNPCWFDAFYGHISTLSLNNCLSKVQPEYMLPTEEEQSMQNILSVMLCAGLVYGKKDVASKVRIPENVHHLAKLFLFLFSKSLDRAVNLLGVNLINARIKLFNKIGFAEVNRYIMNGLDLPNPEEIRLVSAIFAEELSFLFSAYYQDWSIDDLGSLITELFRENIVIDENYLSSSKLNLPVKAKKYSLTDLFNQCGAKAVTKKDTPFYGNVVYLDWPSWSKKRLDQYNTNLEQVRLLTFREKSHLQLFMQQKQQLIKNIYEGDSVWGCTDVIYTTYSVKYHDMPHPPVVYKELINLVKNTEDFKFRGLSCSRDEYINFLLDLRQDLKVYKNLSKLVIAAIEVGDLDFLKKIHNRLSEDGLISAANIALSAAIHRALECRKKDICLWLCSEFDTNLLLNTSEKIAILEKIGENVSIHEELFQVICQKFFPSFKDVKKLKASFLLWSINSYRATIYKLYAEAKSYHFRKEQDGVGASRV
ncbi:MAG: hypothetical protein VX777_10130, partial [Chlamydiota bacterium]|nr:hypothetical protein [Chlamydiota bacterium]